MLVLIYPPPKTQEFYLGILNNYLLPNIGKLKFKEIGARDINMLYRKLRKQGRSDDVIHKVHSTLRAMFYKAYEWELNAEKVMDKVKIEKASKPEYDYWDVDDIMKGLEAFSDSSILFHITVAINLGLREGEVCGLMFEDVDFDKKTLQVKRAIQYNKEAENFKGYKSVQYVKGKTIVKNPKSDSSKRTIPLTDEMATLFRKRMIKISENKLALGQKYCKDWEGFFSVNDDGTILPDSNVGSRFSRKMRATPELKKITFHQLRHSCASWLIYNDVPIIIVMSILGHSDISTTTKYYAHLSEDKKREAMEKLVAK